jgi:hypothetical protein
MLSNILRLIQKDKPDDFKLAEMHKNWQADTENIFRTKCREKKIIKKKPKDDQKKLKGDQSV